MANTNNGSALRWENGGVLRVIKDPGGTPAPYEFLLVDKGSINYQPGLRERILIQDRGEFTGQVKAGDERVSVISFGTGLGITDFDTFLELMTDDPVNGDIPLFTLEIEFAADNGIDTAEGVRFNDCFLPDGPQFQAAGGNDRASGTFTVNALDSTPPCSPPVPA